MAALVTPSDPFVEWPTGIPLPMDISWYHYTAGHVSQNMDAVDWTKIHLHLPLVTMDDAVGRPDPNWKVMFDHPRLDAFWELSLAHWDVAAGVVLIREAGGVVTTLAGDPDVLGGGGIVAGNPALHHWLSDLVRAA